MNSIAPILPSVCRHCPGLMRVALTYLCIRFPPFCLGCLPITIIILTSLPPNSERRRKAHNEEESIVQRFYPLFTPLKTKMKSSFAGGFGSLILSLCASSLSTVVTAFTVSSTTGVLSQQQQQKQIALFRQPQQQRSTRSSTVGLQMSSGGDGNLSPVQHQELMYLEMAKSSGPASPPDVVYILIYNQGTPQEGIHTVEYPKGSESDVLLAFEDLAECYKFAEMLKADPNWPEVPVPSPTGFEQISQACQQMGLPIEIVPTISA